MLLLLGKMAQKQKRHHAPYLREKTHLQLASKNLSSVSVPDPHQADSSILGGQCPNLTFVYLENNFLTSMKGAFLGLPQLVQINLHNNQIAIMDCFEECTLLRKLYLEHNRICRLEGLQNCQRLEELYIGDQKIGKCKFTFDEYSLAAISNTLEILDMPKVNLEQCKPLYFCENLISLNLSDNLIEDFEV